MAKKGKRKHILSSFSPKLEKMVTWLTYGIALVSGFGFLVSHIFRCLEKRHKEALYSERKEVNMARCTFRLVMMKKQNVRMGRMKRNQDMGTTCSADHTRGQTLCFFFSLEGNDLWAVGSFSKSCDMAVFGVLSSTLTFLHGTLLDPVSLQRRTERDLFHSYLATLSQLTVQFSQM